MGIFLNDLGDNPAFILVKIAKTKIVFQSAHHWQDHVEAPSTTFLSELLKQPGPQFLAFLDINKSLEISGHIQAKYRKELYNRL